MEKEISEKCLEKRFLFGDNELVEYVETKQELIDLFKTNMPAYEKEKYDGIRFRLEREGNNSDLIELMEKIQRKLDKLDDLGIFVIRNESGFSNENPHSFLQIYLNFIKSNRDRKLELKKELNLLNKTLDKAFEEYNKINKKDS